MLQFVLSSDGCRIAYERLGEGPTVLLLHGFASSAQQNWADTGWYRVLAKAGSGILALDFRGHGASGKPHDSDSYGNRLLDDVLAVLKAADAPICDVFGYSMGGSVAVLLANAYPQRVRRIILGGIGENYLHKPLPADSIAAALDAADAGTDGGELSSRFRLFADQPGKDRRALAACVRALPPRLSAATLAQIDQPVLVMCGDRDGIAGAPGPLATAFAHGKSVALLGRNHMTAVGDLAAKRAVTDFLAEN